MSTSTHYGKRSGHFIFAWVVICSTPTILVHSPRALRARAPVTFSTIGRLYGRIIYASIALGRGGWFDFAVSR